MLRYKGGSLNMDKIIIDNTVYIPVYQIEDRGFTVPQEKVYNHGIYGPLLSETDYNNLILDNAENPSLTTLEKLELTRFESYQTNVKDTISLRPLKFLFLKNMHMDDKTVSNKILEEDKASLSTLYKTLSDKEFNQYYFKTIDYLKQNLILIQNKLSSLDLTIQFITCIENTTIITRSYIAGTGVFYEMDFSEFDINDLKYFEKVGNTYTFPSEYGEDDTFTVTDTTRNFREYSVFDNIKWCLENCILSDEFNDCFYSHENGIYISIPLKMATKYFNKNSHTNAYYFEGLPDIDISTKK